MGEGFDFDQWSALAANDPDAFERRRAALLDALIARAPAHRQIALRRLQWRVDAERRRSGSDLGACLKLSEMMWERLVGPSGLLDALHGRLVAVQPRTGRTENVGPSRSNVVADSAAKPRRRPGPSEVGASSRAYHRATVLSLRPR